MNRLRKLRTEQGWTQEDLGIKLKVQKSAISKYEIGRSSLTDALIKQLCDIFNCSADYLLGYSNARTNKESLLTKSQREKIIQRELGGTCLHSKGGILPTNLIFRTRLKQLREERGITQQQLADLMHVGRPTVAGYETKGKEPDFDKIVWLANYFGVATDYLLGVSNLRVNKENPLTGQGDKIIQQAFAGTGLLSDDGTLSPESEALVSDFLAQNAGILKKLLKNDM